MDKNPATPGAAGAAPAAPGNDARVITPPSTVTPPAVNDSEGKVTISTKEFAQLSRDAARGRSAQRRVDLTKGRPASPAINAGGDPDAQAAIDEANRRADKAESDAQKAEVRSKVRDVLDKPEFSKIPASTRDLILRNPGVVTEAEDVEVALLDIEDYLRDTASKIDVSGIVPAAPKDAPGRETPPVITPGAPAPSGAIEAQDPSKLHGHAKTQAIIRNKLKGVKPLP